MKRKTTRRPAAAIIYDGTVIAQLATTCPTCGVAIKAQAPADAFCEPPGWHFWGRPGERWKVCEGELNGRAYIHFWTLLNSRRHDRLAWLKPARETVGQPALLEAS